MDTTKKLLSVVIPSYNEEENVLPFYNQLVKALAEDKSLDYELVYVNDGSRDQTVKKIQELAAKDNHVRLINFSRNFGKEIATSAGINHSNGDAIMMIDADGQHPPEIILDFVQKWRSGAQVVVGVRKSNQKEGFIKRYGSRFFYRIFNATTGVKLVPGTTDFTLIDRCVQQEFSKLTERNRITRGLIDWLGFERETIEFKAKPRLLGEASYKFSKLVGLAMNSFISLSLAPLYFSAWAGAIFTILSLLGGTFIVIEQLLLGDPMHLNITGTALLAILLILLVGLLLISQGLSALYISHIHAESQNRPLYIVDRKKSIKL